MKKKFETLESETIIDNPYWEYRRDKYILPGGDTGDYHYVHSNGSTFIIPFLDDETLILTKQYRYLNNRTSIEFPGGGIAKELSPVVNALKELEEETGYSARQLDFLGKFNPFNGVTDEMCYVFTAKQLFGVDALPEESEEIEIIKLNMKSIRELIKKGEIWDGMTLAAFSLLSLAF
jgi:ADP-ribose pyrophosphatase